MASDLSFAQVDAAGNVNVSRFGRRLAGIGGFVNISQGAKRVIFVGTFKAGAAPALDGRGGIALAASGTRKFVDQVEQISFSGAVAAKQGKQVLYVSERAVFALTGTGLMLTEVAPGLDPERDVLAHMGFRPAISPNLREMRPALFTDGPFPLHLATADHQEEVSR